MRNFYIDGVSSATYNIYASGENAYNAAERNVESISVPGRNGDLLIDNGNFKNIDVKYPCVIPYGFSANAIRSWLMSNAGGYHKITDDYDATHFRMGRYKGGIEFKPMYANQAAALVDVTFDCKPQRFLASGETAIVLEGNGNHPVTNPTLFNSKPIIRFFSRGRVLVAGAAITIQSTAVLPQDGYIDFDCETLNAVDNLGENRNSDVVISGTPQLIAGENIVRLTGAGRAIITPRWWEL